MWASDALNNFCNLKHITPNTDFSCGPPGRGKIVEKVERVRREPRKLSFYWTKTVTGLHADGPCASSCDGPAVPWGAGGALWGERRFSSWPCNSQPKEVILIELIFWYLISYRIACSPCCKWQFKDGIVIVTIWEILLKRNQEVYGHVTELAKGS